jgi:uncharacterized protein (DUF433 family)
MNWREHIEINPAVLVGKPVVRGTRLSVELVLDMLAAGVPEPEMFANYPRLTPEAVRACLAYASEALKAERVYPLSA